jgi:hypothetical protein
MKFGPVEGFTTEAHVAPEALALPLGGEVMFSVDHLLPGQSVEWDVPDSSLRFASELTVPCRRLGPGLVSCTIQPDGEQLVCNFRVLPITPDQLRFEHKITVNRSFELSPEVDNADAVTIWKRWSISQVREIDVDPDAPGGPSSGSEADQYLAVAAGTPLALHSRGAMDNPPFRPQMNREMTSLVEWRSGGESIGVGLTTLTSFPFGTHDIEVGPPGFERTLRLTSYEVDITSDPGSEQWQDDLPIQFTATTIPPGFESHVLWMAATKYGSASPVLGRGPTFNTTFAGTFGPGPGGAGTWSWIGVRADNATEGADSKCVSITSVTPLSGIDGSIITINGSGFATQPIDMCVFLGGQGASGRVLTTSPTQITCQIGPVPAVQSGDVSVICGLGRVVAGGFIPVGPNNYVVGNATALVSTEQGNANVNFQLAAANANNDPATYNAANTRLEVTIGAGIANGQTVHVDLHLHCGGGNWVEVVFDITAQQAVAAAQFDADLAAVISTLYNAEGVTATAVGAMLRVTKGGIVGGFGSIQR